MDCPDVFNTVGQTFLSAQQHGPSTADKNVCPPGHTFAAAVAILILASAALRLYRIDAPAVDCFWDKQVAVANLARSMAGPPFHLLNASMDFCISKDGRRVTTTEEIPLYYGLVAAGYRLFGEQDWFGRAISGLGSLVAILAFVGLMRRECDDRFALLAGFFLAFSPLLLFYGRAVIPDTCMLAGMLAAAYCFRRALDQGGVRLGHLQRRRRAAGGGFQVLRPDGAAADGRNGMAPTGSPQGQHRKIRLGRGNDDPAAGGLDVAGVLPQRESRPRRRLFRLPKAGHAAARKSVDAAVRQFPLEELRPVGDGLSGDRRVGRRPPGGAGKKGTVPICAEAARRAVPRKWGLSPFPPAPQLRAVLAWSAMGLGFYFLLAPKSMTHEYYELMMLPAAAAWAAFGFQALGRQARQWGMRPRLAGAIGSCSAGSDGRRPIAVGFRRTISARHRLPAGRRKCARSSVPSGDAWSSGR